MDPLYSFNREVYKRQTNIAYKNNWQRLHLDPILLSSLVLLILAGSAILFSATNQSMLMMSRQGIRLSLALIVMVVFAQISPIRYKAWTPYLYGFGVTLLAVVLAIGVIGKGAQRWLDLGFVRFQPSEIMKLAVPMMVAWYLDEKPLPPSMKSLVVAVVLILIPALLTAKQPDLGTALMIIMAGGAVLLFAGMSWRLILVLGLTVSAMIPILWHFLHQYQRQRVLTFLDPERDPLGSGYHIIQSKIAIGSGGLFGKGWFHGSQSHLQFLPEHATDFIFAVCGEEFGLIGCAVLITLYLLVLTRCLVIANQAQDTYARLVVSALGLTFFLSAFVNIGMVTGILPVVGLPLPLVSYGGTSMVTLMAGFGVMMSIHTHRKLLSR